MAVDVLLGLQWGDEGKGKIVDFLTKDYDLVCRFQGGPNAGHTLYQDGKKVVLHTIPSGIFHKKIINVIGNGVVVNPVTLMEEIDVLEGMGVDVKSRLLICDRAHFILPTHQLLDAASESSKGSTKIGSTLRGIGPTYMDKTGRNGIRIGDMLQNDFYDKVNYLIEKHKTLLTIYDELPPFDLEEAMQKWKEAIIRLREYKIINAIYYLNNALAEGKKVLAEGAQGSMLDIDFGTYPYVTSSNTVSAGVCNGLGVPPTAVNRVYGITKAYCTRVGSGPFPTELHDDMGERIRKAGGEFGATTGRPRRCGWIDLVQLRYSCIINGVTDLIITKADVLNGFEEIKAATSYQVNGSTTMELPLYLDQGNIKPSYTSFEGWTDTTENKIEDQLSEYIQFVSEYLDVPTMMVSIGPGRDEIMMMGG
jgi:adenylosuccinate synthase